ncbi:MAG: ELM1/GtrOC1 family putative glycosyltransferase, partial [Cloacibacillus sp.]
MRNGEALRVILILSDGIRGHLNQSRGVAYWLSQLSGAEVLEAEVPQLSGAAKTRAKAGASALIGGTRRDARDWLAGADGDALIRRVGQWFAERNITENSKAMLFLSAGSTAAPYNLAMGYLWRGACATIMTPGRVGTEPFDFAIVPEHDCPERQPNIFVTLGAPNFVIKENLKKEAAALLAEHPAASPEIWSVLIGGDDANYEITPAWVKKQLGQILNLAQNCGADIYLTTSRRTSDAAVKTIKTLAAHSGVVKYLLVASEDVSEAITGGHRAVLLRTGRKGGVKNMMQRATASLVNAGALSQNLLWGVPKFDRVFDHFVRNDGLIEYRDWLRQRHDGA